MPAKKTKLEIRYDKARKAYNAAYAEGERLRKALKRQDKLILRLARKEESLANLVDRPE